MNPKGHKIHGLYINESMVIREADKRHNACILVALETEDNLIDLNTLHLLAEPGSDAFKFQFK